MSEIADKLKAHHKDGQPTIWMVPSSQDKELLLDLLPPADFLEGQTPNIQNWAVLYQSVAEVVSRSRRMEKNLVRRQIDPPDHQLILRYLVGCFVKKMDEAGVAIPAGIRRSGFIGLLGKNIRELLREDITPPHLGRSLGCAFCEKACEQELSAEKVLCHLYHDYVDYLNTHSLADSAQLPRLIKELLAHETAIAWAKSWHFVWVGFLSFTNSQLNMVRQLLEIGASCSFYVPETGLSSLRDAVEQLVSFPVERSHVSGRIFRLTGGDGSLQLDLLARELALWSLGEGALCEAMTFPGYGSIAIQTTPESLQALRGALKRYRIPVSLRAERSASESVVGELPRRIWEAGISNWGTRTTFYVLSHPCLLGDTLDRERIFQLLPQGVGEWQTHLALDEQKAVFERVVSFFYFLRDKGRQPAELLTAYRDFIEGTDSVNVLGELADTTPDLDWTVREVSSVLRELERKIRFLEELQPGIGEAGEVALRGSEAVFFLSEWSAGVMASLPPLLREAVSLYSAPPAVLESSLVWIMTDVDAAHWPGALRESPLLNNEGRLRINEMQDDEFQPTHIPTLHDERLQKEGLFRRLAATGESLLVLCHALRDRQGRPQGESPFIGSLEKGDWQRVGGRVALLSSLLPQGDEPVLIPAEVHSEDGWFERHTLPVRGVAPLRDEGASLRLSSLDSWLDCPFAYWCQSVMRLEEMNLSPLDIAVTGTLMHTLWERVWQKKRENVGRALYVLTLQVWDDLLQNPPDHCASVVRNPHLKRHLLRLEALIKKTAQLQEDIEQRMKEASIERETTTIEYTLPQYTAEGLLFSGRCDRIDSLASFGEVLVDYKLGKSSHYKENLQLASYARILEEDGASVAGFYYIGHSDSAVKGAFCEDLRSVIMGKKEQRPLDLAQQLELAERAMDTMATGVRSGVYEALYDATGCSRCAYKVLCRRGEFRGDALGSQEEEAKSDE